MATIIDNPNNCPGTDQPDKGDWTSNGGMFRIQLRHRRNGSISYLWTRVTVLKVTNSQIDPTLKIYCDLSSYPSVSVGYGWSSGSNGVVGSVYCSKAIGVELGYNPLDLRMRWADITNGNATFDSFSKKKVQLA